MCLGVKRSWDPLCVLKEALLQEIHDVFICCLIAILMRKALMSHWKKERTICAEEEMVVSLLSLCLLCAFSALYCCLSLPILCPYSVFSLLCPFTTLNTLFTIPVILFPDLHPQFYSFVTSHGR